MSKKKTENSEQITNEQPTALATIEKNTLPILSGYRAFQTQDTDGEPVPTAEEYFEVIKDNMGDRGLTAQTLDKIKVPSGGGLAWEYPTIDGPEVKQKFTAIIVGWRSQRLLWPRPYDESDGTDVPVCISNDGRIGHGSPGGECDECPMAKFMGDEKPKCTQHRLLFILDASTFLPKVLSVPMKSIQIVNKYMLDLISAGNHHWSVLTEFSLSKQESQEGKVYSQLVLKRSKVLTPEEKESIKKYKNIFGPLISQPVISMAAI